MFCDVIKSDISLHMLSAHKHEQKIIDISLLNKIERLASLTQLRRDGIWKSNATILAEGGTSSDLVCERKSVGEKVIYLTCGGVFQKAFFYRHSKNRCQASVVCRPEPVAVPNVRGAEATRNPPWAKLLAKMDRDAILEVATAESTIFCLGKSIFDERKPTKENASFRHAGKTDRIWEFYMESSSFVYEKMLSGMITTVTLLEAAMRQLDNNSKRRKTAEAVQGPKIRTVMCLLVFDVINKKQKTMCD